MNNLKITLYTLLICVLSFDVFPSSPSFDEGRQFRRIQENSPIYLEYNSEIMIQNYGINLAKPGFKIHLFDTKESIGYITTEYKPQNQIIELPLMYINKDYRSKGYGTRALRTIVGIYNAFKEDYPLAEQLQLTCVSGNYAMQKAAKKVGFVKKESDFGGDYIHDYVKDHPVPSVG